jgi:hypothetical protein
VFSGRVTHHGKRREFPLLPTATVAGVTAFAVLSAVRSVSYPPSEPPNPAGPTSNGSASAGVTFDPARNLRTDPDHYVFVNPHPSPACTNQCARLIRRGHTLIVILPANHRWDTQPRSAADTITPIDTLIIQGPAREQTIHRHWGERSVKLTSGPH